MVKAVSDFIITPMQLLILKIINVFFWLVLFFDSYMQFVSIIRIRINFVIIIFTILWNKYVMLCMLIINCNLLLFHLFLYDVNGEFFPIL